MAAGRLVELVLRRLERRGGRASRSALPVPPPAAQLLLVVRAGAARSGAPAGRDRVRRGRPRREAPDRELRQAVRRGERAPGLRERAGRQRSPGRPAARRSPPGRRPTTRSWWSPTTSSAVSGTTSRHPGRAAGRGACTTSSARHPHSGAAAQHVDAQVRRGPHRLRHHLDPGHDRARPAPGSAELAGRPRPRPAARLGRRRGEAALTLVAVPTVDKRPLLPRRSGLCTSGRRFCERKSTAERASRTTRCQDREGAAVGVPCSNRRGETPVDGQVEASWRSVEGLEGCVAARRARRGCRRRGADAAEGRRAARDPALLRRVGALFGPHTGRLVVIVRLDRRRERSRRASRRSSPSGCSTTRSS